MQNSLYPHPAEDKCPYCKSKNIKNTQSAMGNFSPTACQCEISFFCSDCKKTHHLRYQSVGIVLEDDNDPPNLKEFNLGYEIPDMSKEGEPDQGKTLVSAVQAADGLFIQAHGYNDGASTPGYGCPALIEMCDGALRVVVWNDINDDDVSDIISLENAKMKYGSPIEALRYEVTLMTPHDEPVESHCFDDPEKAMAYDKIVVPSGHYTLVVDRMNENKILKDSRK